MPETSQSSSCPRMTDSGVRPSAMRASGERSRSLLTSMFFSRWSNGAEQPQIERASGPVRVRSASRLCSHELDPREVQTSREAPLDQVSGHGSTSAPGVPVARGERSLDSAISTHQPPGDFELLLDLLAVRREVDGPTVQMLVAPELARACARAAGCGPVLSRAAGGGECEERGLTSRTVRPF